MDFKDKIIEKIKSTFQTISDFLNEQAWFQELKSKWQDLDSENKNYIKFAAFVLSVCFCCWFILSSIWSVHRLKSELTEKRELLKSIQFTQDEIRRYRDSIPPSIQANDLMNAKSSEGSWITYFESLGAPLGFEKQQINVSDEKIGEKTEDSKESLFNIQLKHINIKQLVKYTYSIENGMRPAKVRYLMLDTGGDDSGYLDAQISLSAFTRTAQ